MNMVITTKDTAHDEEARRLVSALYNVSLNDQQKHDDEDVEHRTLKVRSGHNNTIVNNTWLVGKTDRSQRRGHGVAQRYHIYTYAAWKRRDAV
ncbi:hypothetical protein G6F57_023049 [Rhizopus arrhizus]|nr:hypothetical protein G6F57_023049 [Rhizopus arrhizus]